MIYFYKTKIGTWTIRPQRSDPNRAEIWMAGECYGSYSSALMAASDVAAHATGCSAWDSATHLEAPEDLDEWRSSN